MVEFTAPENVGVEEFFKSYVPKQFQEAVASADMSSMKGKLFTLQFNVDSKKFCLKVQDGTGLEIVEGGIDKPMLELKVSEKLWRQSISGKLPGTMDQFTDPAQVADAQRYETMMNTKGTLDLELGAGGDTHALSLVFHGEPSPQVKLRLDLADWVAMQKKEADPTQLFMAGKVQFEGDMMFLMSLQSLM